MNSALPGGDERGYAMAALLVAMSVMAIVLSTAMPVYQTVARREREAELVFRGEQYARAIALFQRKYGNALPPDVDVLIDQRFLRKKYKDPITGDDFQFLGAGSPELAQALSTTPQQALDAQRGRGAAEEQRERTPRRRAGTGDSRSRTTAVSDEGHRSASSQGTARGAASCAWTDDGGWTGRECAGRRRDSCRREQEHSDVDAAVQRQEQVQRVDLHGGRGHDRGWCATRIGWPDTRRPRRKSRWSRRRRPGRSQRNAQRHRAVAVAAAGGFSPMGADRRNCSSSSRVLPSPHRATRVVSA